MIVAFKSKVVGPGVVCVVSGGCVMLKKFLIYE